MVNPRSLRVKFWGVKRLHPRTGPGAGRSGRQHILHRDRPGRPAPRGPRCGHRACALSAWISSGGRGEEATRLASSKATCTGTTCRGSLSSRRCTSRIGRSHSTLPGPRRSSKGPVRTLTSQPYFADESAILAELSCCQVGLDGMEVNGLTIRPFPVNHPGGAHGFRIEADGHSIVYATDHEHGDAETDRRIREEARGADLLIWDANTPRKTTVPTRAGATARGSKGRARRPTQG